jgi:hypothetical protein
MVSGNSDTKIFKFRDVVRGLEDSNTEQVAIQRQGFKKLLPLLFVLPVRPFKALKYHFRTRRNMR